MLNIQILLLAVSVSWCEVASILVTDGEAQGLLQTLWRCKSQAMLVLLWWLRGFTPECERTRGRKPCKPEDPLQRLSQTQLFLPPQRLSKQGFLSVKEH